MFVSAFWFLLAVSFIEIGVRANHLPDDGHELRLENQLSNLDNLLIRPKERQLSLEHKTNFGKERIVENHGDFEGGIATLEMGHKEQFSVGSATADQKLVTRSKQKKDGKGDSTGNGGGKTENRGDKSGKGNGGGKTENRGDKSGKGGPKGGFGSLSLRRTVRGITNGMSFGKGLKDLTSIKSKNKSKVKNLLKGGKPVAVGNPSFQRSESFSYPRKHKDREPKTKHWSQRKEHLLPSNLAEQERQDRLNEINDNKRLAADYEIPIKKTKKGNLEKLTSFQWTKMLAEEKVREYSLSVTIERGDDEIDLEDGYSSATGGDGTSSPRKKLLRRSSTVHELTPEETCEMYKNYVTRYDDSLEKLPLNRVPTIVHYDHPAVYFTTVDGKIGFIKGDDSDPNIPENVLNIPRILIAVDMEIFLQGARDKGSRAVVHRDVLEKYSTNKLTAAEINQMFWAN